MTSPDEFRAAATASRMLAAGRRFGADEADARMAAEASVQHDSEPIGNPIAAFRASDLQAAFEADSA